MTKKCQNCHFWRTLGDNLVNTPLSGETAQRAHQNKGMSRAALPHAQASPTELGLRERKKFDSYRSIQAAGVTLIARHGLASTTIDDIAAHAQVSPRTVHRYFRTKEAILFSTWAFRDVPQRFTEQPRTLSPLEALENALTQHGAATNEPIDQQRRRLRLSLMHHPAVSRFAVEAAESLSSELRTRALTWLDASPHRLATADLLGALMRMFLMSHFNGEPLLDPPLAPWLAAMQQLTHPANDTQDADAHQ